MKAILLIAFVTLFVTCPAALARPGDLDSTFGVNGVVQTILGNKWNPYSFNSCIIQNDGKFIISGNIGITPKTQILIIRYDSTGQIDSSFGNNGIIKPAFVKEDEYTSCSYLFVQSDGKILVSGSLYSMYPYPGETKSMILRYTPNGKPDSSFFTNGKLIDWQYSNYNPTLVDVGKIYMAGIIYTGLNYVSEIIRLNYDFTVDSTFNNNGKLLINFDDGKDSFLSVRCIQNEEKILLSGMTRDTGIKDPNNFRSQLSLQRIFNNGCIDSSFGLNGKVVLDFESANIKNSGETKLQADGKILCSGIYGNAEINHLLLIRLDQNGNLDKNFGDSGIKKIFISSDGETGNISLDSNGSIFVGGSAKIMSVSYVFLEKLNGIGNIDFTFGNHGKVERLIGENSNNYGRIYSPIINNKIIWAGSIMDDSSRSGILLLKFKLDTDVGIIDNNSFNDLFYLFPNPIVTTAWIKYSLPKDEYLSVELYDMSGRKIKTLIDNQYRQSGNHSENFDLNTIPSGRYFIRINNKTSTISIKILME